MQEQTYEISMQDGFRIFQESEEFRKVLEPGYFIHCENRFVINHPNYVVFDKDGKASLTQYAKEHNEECCLIFNLVPKNTEKEL